MLAVNMIVEHGPAESSLLMVRSRVSSSSEVVDRVLVLSSSTLLCLFKCMRLTAISKPGWNYALMKKCACTFKKGVLNSPSLRYITTCKTHQFSLNAMILDEDELNGSES